MNETEVGNRNRVLPRWIVLLVVGILMTAIAGLVAALIIVQSNIVEGNVTVHPAPKLGLTYSGWVADANVEAAWVFSTWIKNLADFPMTINYTLTTKSADNAQNYTSVNFAGGQAKLGGCTYPMGIVCTYTSTTWSLAPNAVLQVDISVTFHQPVVFHVAVYVTGVG